MQLKLERTWLSLRARFAHALFVGMFAAAWLCSPASLRADEAEADASGADANDPYRGVVKRAILEYQHGNWEEAFALFQRAHEIEPNARTLRGLGLTSFEMRDYVQALAYLQAALADRRKPLDEPQREELEKVIRHARDYVAVYHVRVKPPDAEIIVDGKRSTARELLLNPGPHTVLVRKPGFPPRREEIHAGAGGEHELTLELTVDKYPTSAASPGQGGPANGAPSSGRKLRPWLWTLGGVAVAAGVTAIGLRLRVRGLEREYEACSDAGGACNAIAGYGDRLLLASYATAAVAGALAVGVAVASVVALRKGARGETAVAVGPLGAAVRTRF